MSERIRHAGYITGLIDEPCAPPAGLTEAGETIWKQGWQSGHAEAAVADLQKLLATVPDDLLQAEWQRRLAKRRKSYTGGAVWASHNPDSNRCRCVACTARRAKPEAFSAGKRCERCGGPVDNRTKVLTCQQCRAERRAEVTA